MKTDNFKVVYNDPETYRDIRVLLQKGTVILKWSDDGGSMYTVLLTYGGSVDPYVMYPSEKFLYVGVQGTGFFGFNVENYQVSPTYVAEKLNLPMGSARPMATLLTEIMKP